MKAIYKGKLYTIVGDCANLVDLVSVEDDATISVLWGDPSLVIDPTDDQITNILPDYFEEKGLIVDSHTATQRTIAMLQTEVDYLIARPIDQIVGCNVHGRLTCILALLDAGDLPTVRLELERLLKFFPKPVA